MILSLNDMDLDFKLMGYTPISFFCFCAHAHLFEKLGELLLFSDY